VIGRAGYGIGGNLPMVVSVHKPRKAIRDSLRAMFERSPDPYAGADLDTSRRFQAGLLGLCALLTLSFLPFEPVDEEIGAAGWAVAVAVGLAGVAGAVAMARRRPSYDDQLAVAYAGIAGIAALNYLAGGGSSAYEDLYVLWLGAGASHPPRRALAHLATMVAALALPLIYEGTGGEILGDMAAEALILVSIGLLLTAYQAGVRRQRLGLRSGAEVARRLAGVDPLTGLGNRRAFDEALTVEIARCDRQGSPLVVGLVDLDNLKRINDRYGHMEGDRSLGKVARILEAAVRETDRCFRWGGDEFVIVLPATDRVVAEEVLVRMAKAVAAVCETQDHRPVTLTYGSAEFDDGMTIDDVMALADLSLLGNKPAKHD
jgi:diguanylate cyclase (GGDEF)-like protein